MNYLIYQWPFIKGNLKIPGEFDNILLHIDQFLYAELFSFLKNS